MPAPQPIAVVGDTLTLVVLLMAARYAVVAWKGERGWWGRAAVWARRVALVAVLMVALRLTSIAVMRPEIALPVSGFVVMMLAGGAALVAGDRFATRLIAARR